VITSNGHNKNGDKVFKFKCSVCKNTQSFDRKYETITQSANEKYKLELFKVLI